MVEAAIIWSSGGGRLDHPEQGVGSSVPSSGAIAGSGSSIRRRKQR